MGDLKKWIFITLITIPFSNLYSKQVYCEVKVNTELVYKTQFNGNKPSKTILGEFNGYKISLLNKGQSNFEIEAYNREIPSRTYALGTLNKLNDQVHLDLWNRDLLLGSSCQQSDE